jgi:hypothetical protein
VGYFAGLDVEGKPVLETSVTTDPDTIFAALRKYVRSLRRVGHEAGSLSPWLQVSSSNAVFRRSAWRPGMGGCHCRRCATKPTRRMRAGLRISCAPADSSRSP